MTSSNRFTQSVAFCSNIPSVHASYSGEQRVAQTSPIYRSPSHPHRDKIIFDKENRKRRDESIPPLEYKLNGFNHRPHTLALSPTHFWVKSNHGQ
jgi:hypothetical protein